MKLIKSFTVVHNGPETLVEPREDEKRRRRAPLVTVATLFLMLI